MYGRDIPFNPIFQFNVYETLVRKWRRHNTYLYVKKHFWFSTTTVMYSNKDAAITLDKENSTRTCWDFAIPFNENGASRNVF